MKLTIDWLVHRSTLKDLELLTCADLADTVITGVNILDNPDTVKWFHSGELVLTTGYIFLDDEDLQKQIFQNLKDAGCAAVALKTRRFFQEIPEHMLRLSEEIRLPLIELPYYYSLADIISVVDRRLYHSQSRAESHPFGAAHYYDSFFRYLLESETDSDAALPQLCQYYGIPCPPRAVCAVISRSGGAGQFSTQKLASRIRELTKAHSLPSASCFTAFNQNLLSLCLFDDSASLIRSFRELLQALLESFPGELSIGTGALTAEPLLSAFRKAACMCSLDKYFPDEHLFYFSDYFLFWQITKLSEEEKAAICAMTVQPLADFDAENHTNLLDTLRMYYQCHLNSSLAASRMYIHRNTFLKRMERIQALIKFQPEHPGNLFSVYYGLCVYLTLH